MDKLLTQGSAISSTAMKRAHFDCSLLPPSRCEFIVIGDTHYMLDPGDQPLEFASRRRQTGRAGAALHLAAALAPDFAVHLGDLVQEYPDTPAFTRALDEALEQLRASGLAVRHVAGFGHLFTAGPPPEQGRDDAPKLGFYLCRALDDRTDLHLIRTHGDSTPDPCTRIVTPTPAGLQGAPLGITLRHPLAPATEVPLAWPSAIRQPVRNDYPLLACLELGATAARLPWTDFAAPLQRGRLSLLRAEGVEIQAFGPAPGDLDLHGLLDAHPACADAWELQLPGNPWPSDACLRRLRDSRRRTSLCLSVLLPGQRVPSSKSSPPKPGAAATLPSPGASRIRASGEK